MIALLLAAALAAELPPDLAEGWYARIETTGGTMVARLHPDNAPQATAHFAALAEGRLPWADLVTGEERRGRYYDDMAIHGAFAGERIEIGDRSGTGHGAPRIYVPLERGPMGFHRPYRLGMARIGLGRISGAMFFVSVAGLPWLTGRHPCIGELVSGQEVAFGLASVTTNSQGKPRDPVIVRSVRILAVGSPPPLPEPVAHVPPPAPTFGVKDRPSAPPR